ncbi:MAG: hypothetical protein GXP63_05950 [DPANN group archaeon]|nr:hypothetical protein [DPANN group archaeon]
MGKIIVLMDPEQRKAYLQEQLNIDGINPVKENPQGAYAPIALTSAPKKIRKYLQSRQDILINDVLLPLGIIAHDPAKDKLSPYENPHIPHTDVHRGDTLKILQNRYFVGHNILPSTGVGDELEKAARYNRMAVILMDKNIRISTMLPHRIIYLQYDDFSEQKKEIADVIMVLQQFDPGMGLEDDVPVLLGFEKQNGSGIINLEKTIYQEFPHLRYDVDGNKDIVQFSVKNPQIFSEYKKEKNAGQLDLFS